MQLCAVRLSHACSRSEWLYWCTAFCDALYVHKCVVRVGVMSTSSRCTRQLSAWRRPHNVLVCRQCSSADGTWNRTASHSSVIAPASSRPRIFRYGCQPIFQDAVSGENSSHSAVHLHRKREEDLGLRVVWYRFSGDATHVRSKPCTNCCALCTSPLD